jgi:hypothetical protein
LIAPSECANAGLRLRGQRTADVGRAHASAATGKVGRAPHRDVSGQASPQSRSHCGLAAMRAPVCLIDGR